MTKQRLRNEFFIAALGRKKTNWFNSRCFWFVNAEEKVDKEITKLKRTNWVSKTRAVTRGGLNQSNLEI